MSNQFAFFPCNVLGKYYNLCASMSSPFVTHTLVNFPMWVTASLPSWNLGNGICNTFGATIAIVGDTCITIDMNWENKWVSWATNVGLSCCSDCRSTVSNNGFFTILIFSSATLLSSYDIDFSSTLIS
jgi:hypothetical protein